MARAVQGYGDGKQPAVALFLQEVHRTGLRHDVVRKRCELAQTVDVVQTILPYGRSVDVMEDFLDGYYEAALKLQTPIIVRIRAESPFVEPDIIDSCVQTFLRCHGIPDYPHGLNSPRGEAFTGGIEYLSNRIQPSFPKGLEVEVFSWAALRWSWYRSMPNLNHPQGDLTARREVTTLMTKGPWKCHSLVQAPDMSHLDWRWGAPGVDELHRAVVQKYGPRFTMGNVLNEEGNHVSED